MSVKENPLDDNQRTEPRLPHNEVIYVEIMTPGAVESDDLNPAVRATETVDISANGLQVRIPEALRVGAILQICILREKTGDKFHLTAEVKWRKRLPGTYGYMTGLAFFESEETSIAEWKLAVSAMFSDEDADHADHVTH
ncbi:PilZ domain-containing protein [Hahella sp. KA22]|uniref:PilZ domain-containing protein n=1 Tax=Hahella sp. KA22 TaxID=1628392 RepID=UPI000FDEBB0D|nr:PilZ domain-containing protein [Hahella sp. KA22]AZZ91777.1 PilZ domain-containing protein [Hahella sp. KA22]QAY55147.1 PilZ domain-containing protein [Hahella sp. KA22]